MSTNVLLNGNVYAIPAVGEDNWGQNLTDYFIAIPSAVLQRNGGNFTITSDVNFGPSFGLLAKYFSGRSNAADAGLFRLANGDVVSWRNFAGTGNLDLGVNASDQLVFDGGIIVPNAITSIYGQPLPDGQIIVGNVSNLSAAVPVSGDVTLSNAGVILIGANKVTNALLAQIATASFKGRATAGTGNVEDLSATQATAILNAMVGDSGAGGVKGLVPAPAAGDAAALKFLKADGTWQAPGGSSLVSFTIANNQTSPANVTGFLIDKAVNKAFTSELSVSRRYADSFSQNSVFNEAVGTGATPSSARAVAVAADGSQYVGGEFSVFNGSARLYLVKLSANGGEDSAFYANLGTGFNDGITSIAIQADGKILCAGVFSTLNGVSVPGLARLNVDGTPDTAFNANSSALTGSTSFVFVQTDQKIVTRAASSKRCVRLNTDGTEDTTFSANIGTGFSSPPLAVGELSDTRLAIVGPHNTFNGVSRIGLVMLNNNGTLDTAFMTALGGNPNNEVHDVAVQSDDAIVITGKFTTVGGGAQLRVARISGAGIIDAAFKTAIGSGLDQTGEVVKVLANGKIMLGGSFTLLNGISSNSIGLLDSTGAPNAAFTSAIGTGFDAAVYGLAEDGISVTIVGDFLSFNGVTNPARISSFLNAIELAEEFTLRGVYRDALVAWTIGAQAGFGDDTGLTLSMTSAGQLQYESSNLSGTLIESALKFRITDM